MYDAIYDLINSNNLLEANNQLKFIDKALTNQDVNRSSFCKKFSQAIIENIRMGMIDFIFEETKPKYRIYPSYSTISAYLFTFGLAFGKVRETRTNIKKVIFDIDKNIIEPSGNYLSIEKEKTILSILTEKYPHYWQFVSTDKPLGIININNTHRLFNSICGASEDTSSVVIYMFNMKENLLAPEYVFLHELGHALQISLTGSDILVPEEFIIFNNSLPDVDLKQGDSEAPELFADTFAIAVMRNTILNEYNPFPFSDALNEAFELFHTKLFNRLMSMPR